MYHNGNATIGGTCIETSFNSFLLEHKKVLSDKLVSQPALSNTASRNTKTNQPVARVSAKKIWQAANNFCFAKSKISQV